MSIPTPRQTARIAVVSQVRKWLDPMATFKAPWLPLRDNCVAVSQQGVRYNLPFEGFKETKFDFHSSDHLDALRGVYYDGLIYYCETLYGDDAILVGSRIMNSKIKRLTNLVNPDETIPVIEYPVIYTWSYEALAQAFLDVLTIGNLSAFSQVPLEVE